MFLSSGLVDIDITRFVLEKDICGCARTIAAKSELFAGLPVEARDVAINEAVSAVTLPERELIESVGK